MAPRESGNLNFVEQPESDSELRSSKTPHLQDADTQQRYGEKVVDLEHHCLLFAEESQQEEEGTESALKYTRCPDFSCWFPEVPHWGGEVGIMGGLAIVTTRKFSEFTALRDASDHLRGLTKSVA